MSWLQGKKTYIAAAGLALLSVVSFIDGDTVKGMELALAALAAAGLRQAVAAK